MAVLSFAVLTGAFAGGQEREYWPCQSVDPGMSIGMANAWVAASAAACAAACAAAFAAACVDACADASDDTLAAKLAVCADNTLVVFATAAASVSLVVLFILRILLELPTKKAGDRMTPKISHGAFTQDEIRAVVALPASLLFGCLPQLSSCGEWVLFRDVLGSASIAISLP